MWVSFISIASVTKPFETTKQSKKIYPGINYTRLSTRAIFLAAIFLAIVIITMARKIAAR